ncbi:MAG: HPF/RaiA family ribosome-associated protein [Spirochaetota bacterium]
MEVPIEITFRNADHTDQIDQLIRDEAARLERFHDRITSCHAIVERPQEHLHSGRQWRVRLDITIPRGNEVVVRKEAGKGDMHEQLATVIKDAFDAAERQIKELHERQRGDVKQSAESDFVGIVTRVFPEEGYGFIMDPSEQDIYFHRNAVLGGGFDRITEGTAVWYQTEVGDDGLQATSVRIEDKPGRRRDREDTEPGPIEP